jgi:hypothetical protein
MLQPHTNDKNYYHTQHLCASDGAVSAERCAQCRLVAARPGQPHQLQPSRKQVARAAGEGVGGLPVPCLHGEKQHMSQRAAKQWLWAQQRGRARKGNGAGGLPVARLRGATQNI